MQPEAIAAHFADLDARIDAIEQKTAWPICGEHTARISNLERYEENQNSHLVRIEQKVDALKTLLLCACGATVAALGGLVVQLMREAK